VPGLPAGRPHTHDPSLIVVDAGFVDQGRLAAVPHSVALFPVGNAGEVALSLALVRPSGPGSGGSPRPSSGTRGTSVGMEYHDPAAIA
jgi:hypothetical protein